MNEPARKIKSPSPPVVLATLEDLLAIPEEERRHELIEGTIYPTKEAASAEHGSAQWALSAWLGPYGRRPGGRQPGGWWFVTEVEIYFDAKNTFKPDVAGWRRERVPERPTGTPIRTHPDWVCEILSTNRGHDLVKKKRVYHRHQVMHYWIIDPVDQILWVNRWNPDGYTEVLAGTYDEIVCPEPFEVLPLQVKVLFGGEPDDETEQKDVVKSDDEPTDAP